MRNMKQAGYTLIEILIVVAIVASVAAIAVSSYSGSGYTARKSQGIAGFEALKGAMEQDFQSTFSYRSPATNTPEEIVTIMTSRYRIRLPNYYTYRIHVSTDQQEYFISAEPIGPQDGDGGMAQLFNETQCYYPTSDAGKPPVDSAKKASACS